MGLCTIDGADTIRLWPGYLRGQLHAPQSKSLLHRQLICAHLAGQEAPLLHDPCDDVLRTVEGLWALRNGADIVDCGACGAALRFLLPLSMALGRVGITFTGTARLLSRPMPAPLPMERTSRGWRVTGTLHGGDYALSGSETSQLISGLMMALPLLDSASRIHLTSHAVSPGYIRMTRQVLRRFGVTVADTADGFSIPAPQTFTPAPLPAEGDWSSAGWYLAVNKLGRGTVDVRGLQEDSCQSDRIIVDYLRVLPACVDISPTPDLLPTLSLVAAASGQAVTFTHGAFLRGKESDRLAAVTRTLCALGVSARETADGLTIQGGALRGGTAVDSRGDHRMAMLCAFAALFCKEPIVLHGAGCVDKSYPAFWRDYTALGGKAEVLTV